MYQKAQRNYNFSFYCYKIFLVFDVLTFILDIENVTKYLQQFQYYPYVLFVYYFLDNHFDFL